MSATIICVLVASSPPAASHNERLSDVHTDLLKCELQPHITNVSRVCGASFQLGKCTVFAHVAEYVCFICFDEGVMDSSEVMRNMRSHTYYLRTCGCVCVCVLAAKKS